MKRTWRIAGFQLLTAAVLLAVLWVVVDGRAAFQRLADAQPQWLFACWLALNLQTILSAMRWRITAAALGMQISRPTAIREYYVAHVVNQLLPGGVVGDVGRAVRARPLDERPGAALARSGEAVFFERFAGQVVLGSVMAAGFVFTFAMPGGLDAPEEGAVSVLIVAVVAIVLIGLLRIAVHRRVTFARRISQSARQVFVAAGIWKHQLLLGIAIAACNIAGFAFAALATGTALGFEASVTIVPLILFSMVIPLTISGWGFREGAAAALFPLVGASADAGLAASVAFGVMMLASSLPGALWLWPNANVRGFLASRETGELPPATGALQSIKTGKSTQ
ncbi:lysylphosphatidylglycerol synthase transmembrane domain-containing protein [Mesorhizobium sp. CAU 1741]|uniref:lysylphosphatidylglycerol synthase transmembrane domain-containing protein n=1 Tax=Mesorhizobium sp. CAU 1741 TaxID=3140366 RepID=UPI00325A5933